MRIPASRLAPYPSRFHALAEGAVVEVGPDKFHLSVVDCGELALESGKLVACDPFVELRGDGTDAFIELPKGRYRVRVTLADVSDHHDGSHMREAYASLIVAERPEVERKLVCLLEDGVAPTPLADGEIWGFGVDSGTACFADKATIERDMPPPSTWHDAIFDNGTAGSWFARMDDPAHIRPGLANIPLPKGDGTSNIVIIHAGWGDGLYPVIAGFDAAGELVAVHIDFYVLADEPSDLPDEEKSALRSRVI